MTLAVSSAATPSRPSLLVIVVVDGLSWDRLQAWRSAWTGGLAELLAQGHVAARTHYAHLNTETCPGHAALSTGAAPRVTGIVGNVWYREGQRVSCVAEAPGRVGPATLHVDGLGDVLGPGARVVSLSGKDRAAIMLAGRGRKHAAFWLDLEDGRFVTSEAYDRAAPVVAAVQAIVERPGPLRKQGLWERLPGEMRVPVVPAHTLAMRQFPELGLGFPHDPALHPNGVFEGLVHSPAIDLALTDLALAVLSDPALKLGRSGGTDLLALSYSGPDNVAHDYGDGSEEHLDTLRRLDRELGRLLQTLRARPTGSVLLALSADHGFLPADAPFQQRLETSGERSAIAALNAVLRAQLCLPPGAKPVAGMASWHLYFDPAAGSATTGAACGPPRPLREALVAAVPEAMRSLWPDAVASVVERGASVPVELRSFVENATYAGRSGDLLVFPQPGALSHWDPARAWGHGSHHAYDTHVPLIFWGAGVPAGCSDAPATPYDLAPTLAAFTGARLPQAMGRSLGDEIAKSAGRVCSSK
jgi:arylsulfatase A-like enzyme